MDSGGMSAKVLFVFDCVSASPTGRMNFYRI